MLVSFTHSLGGVQNIKCQQEILEDDVVKILCLYLNLFRVYEIKYWEVIQGQYLVSLLDFQLVFQK